MQKKYERGDTSVSSAFANARKSFWLKQGLEPVTAGFTVNRVKSVLQDEVCGVTKKKEKKLATVIVGLFSLEKRRLKIATIGLIKVGRFSRFFSRSIAI